MKPPLQGDQYWPADPPSGAAANPSPKVGIVFKLFACFAVCPPAWTAVYYTAKFISHHVKLH